LSFTFKYNATLFEEESIKKLITFFTKIITSIINAPGEKISEIEIMAEEEKKRIIYDFNDTEAEYPRKTLHELFTEQSEKTPDNIAITGQSLKDGTMETEGRHALSYKELDRQSTQLAHLLVQKGIQPGAVAAVMTERSLEMIIAMMAILKAGCAYLPIAPDYPTDRIQYMLQDSNAPLLVTTTALANKEGINKEIIDLQQLDHLNLYGAHELPPSSITQLCCVIYTSGSTGKPKGVMIEHDSLVNLVFAQKRLFKIRENDRVLQFSSICFDASGEQIYISLLSGATLALVKKETLIDNEKFEVYVKEQSITHLHAVPSFLLTLTLENNRGLKRIVSGGDVFQPELAEKWAANYDLYNKYGPTETTVTSIETKIDNRRRNSDSIPIGKPVANTMVYLCDENIKPVPVGVPGELYIGGQGVARGYLNRPQLTAEKFLPNPFVKETHLANKHHTAYIYKTGDLARWRSDGTLDFLGRIDNQVKIRGFRIELGEIENRLLEHQYVREAVVMAKENKTGDKSLWAYIVTHSSPTSPETDNTPQNISLSEMKRFLSGHLPEYMIPSFFVYLEKIPLTPNGKVDRKALDKYETNVKSGTRYVAPASEIEKTIAGIWQDILEIDEVGVNDNFFDIGGNSLSIIKVHTELKRIFAKDISIGTMFRYPTIRDLAEGITPGETEKLSPDSRDSIEENLDLMDEATDVLFADELD
ncbi:MAG: amino acid adenylation domain-containing protein, partial [bacterium]|nr:amino acid adenylation domain-containing protein [bacterium]